MAVLSFSAVPSQWCSNSTTVQWAITLNVFLDKKINIKHNFQSNYRTLRQMCPVLKTTECVLLNLDLYSENSPGHLLMFHCVLLLYRSVLPVFSYTGAGVVRQCAVI